MSLCLFIEPNLCFLLRYWSIGHDQSTLSVLNLKMAELKHDTWCMTWGTSGQVNRISNLQILRTLKNAEMDAGNTMRKQRSMYGIPDGICPIHPCIAIDGCSCNVPVCIHEWQCGTRNPIVDYHWNVNTIYSKSWHAWVHQGCPGKVNSTRHQKTVPVAMRHASLCQIEPCSASYSWFADCAANDKCPTATIQTPISSTGAWLPNIKLTLNQLHLNNETSPMSCSS